jgi:integrase
MPADIRLEPQRTLNLQSDVVDDDSNCLTPGLLSPDKTPGKPPKRKPSARAPWADAEIPIILDSLKGRYRVRNQALIACNVVWGLRAHEMLDVRMGDLLTIGPDGSWTFKDSFTMEGARLKGGKPRPPWHPKPYPADHVVGCMCNKCGGQKEPKRSAPEVRHLFVLDQMHDYLQPWIMEVEQRVGKLTDDLFLWLSRKRHKDKITKVKSWRPLTRQSFWFIVVEAAKIAEPIINDPTFSWKDCGSHSCRKTLACAFESIEDAQHALGHKSSGTTSAYRANNPREQRRLQQKVGARLLRKAAA